MQLTSRSLPTIVQEQLIPQGQQCISKVFLLQYTGSCLYLLKTHKLTPENLLNMDIKDCNVLGTSAPYASLHFCNWYWNLLVQAFAKTPQTNFVKTAVNTLETCSTVKNAQPKLEKLKSINQCFPLRRQISKHFTHVCVETQYQKLLNVHWRSIPTSTPRPVKPLSNWTKFAWTLLSPNVENSYIPKKRNCNWWQPLCLIANIVVHYML